MENKEQKALRKIIALGIISGMRATFAPAITAHYLSKKPISVLTKSKLSFIQSPATAIITKLLSAAEITGDKLPNTPNRVVASQITARAASGAFAGAVISTINEDNTAKGIFIGGVMALAATFATYHLRKYISKHTFIKEPVTGALEDVLALGIGVLTMNKM